MQKKYLFKIVLLYFSLNYAKLFGKFSKNLYNKLFNQYYICTMKIMLQKLPRAHGSSFLVDRYESPNFETPYHQHHELEIVLCDGGHGTKFIGNQTAAYQEGDVDFLGKNLPHWYRANDQYYSSESDKKPASLVIHFVPEIFGETFWQLPEMKKVAQFINSSKSGFSFGQTVKETIAQKMRAMLKKSASERLVALLELLQFMAETDDKTTMTADFEGTNNSKDSNRMHLILDYLMTNFKNDIGLDQLATITNMSKASLCRYFKEKTKRTLVEYINALRLDFSCTLLVQTDRLIIEICEQSGFNNLSNFNRQFVAKYGCSPKDYRRNFLNNISKGSM
jgi:AraC-like DNA-binding protein